MEFVKSKHLPIRNTYTIKVGGDLDGGPEEFDQLICPQHSSRVIETIELHADGEGRHDYCITFWRVAESDKVYYGESIWYEGEDWEISTCTDGLFFYYPGHNPSASPHFEQGCRAFKEKLYPTPAWCTQYDDD